MNDFVESKYDEFKQKEVIKLKEHRKLDITNSHMDIYGADVGFRRVKIEEHEIFVIDIDVTSSEGVGLSNGQLLLIIDGNHLQLSAHENFSGPYEPYYILLGHIESCWYELSVNDIKTLCDASSIAMRITNGDGYADLSTKNLQIGARAIYNAVVDHDSYSEFLSELFQKEQEKRQKEQEEERIIYEQIQLEKKLKEEEENRKFKNKQIRDKLDDAMLIIGIVGGLITFIVGGIWSILAEKWAPILLTGSFTIISIAILLYLKNVTYSDK